MPRAGFWAMVIAAMAVQLTAAWGTRLPAQDGLKFFRIARDFQTQPFADTVRASDQHPLYSWLVSLAQPWAETWVGPGAESWLIAGLGTAMVGYWLMLIPLGLLARDCVGVDGARVAVIAALVLPLPAGVGRDTLSDGWGLFGSILTLYWGQRALRLDRHWNVRLRDALLAGAAAGAGYWARPEVMAAALAVMVTIGLQTVAQRRRRDGLVLVIMMSVGLLLTLAPYGLVKGTLSDKLSVRNGLGSLGMGAGSEDAETVIPRSVPHVLRVLGISESDARGAGCWDFSPKEERVAGENASSAGLGRRGLAAGWELVRRWGEGMAWVIALFVPWGLAAGWRAGAFGWRPWGNSGAWVSAVYGGLFSVVLIRHATGLGYLSDRHVLGLVLVALPWAGLGMLRVMPEKRVLRIAAFGIAVAVMLCLQLRPDHPSRWGHWAAGRWLALNAGADEAVLDTRGWARFISEKRGYDYWHVGQALSDAKLGYIVVGDDELSGGTQRAKTLHAILAHTSVRVAGFPGRKEGDHPEIWIYRYRRPATWEGMTP